MVNGFRNHFFQPPTTHWPTCFSYLFAWCGGWVHRPYHFGGVFLFFTPYTAFWPHFNHSSQNDDVRRTVSFCSVYSCLHHPAPYGTGPIPSPDGKTDSQMTLPRLIVTAIWMACGVVLSSRLGRIWGTFGYVCGFLAGFVIVSCVTWAIVLSRNLLLMPFPACRHGKCRTFRDYVWKRGTIYGWEKGGIFRYRCRCGDEYIRDGNRFLEVLSDGTTRPYKKHQRGNKWVDDVP